MSVPTYLPIKIKYRTVEDLDLVLIKKLLMVLSHQFLAFGCELRRDFNKDIFALSIYVKVVVFKEVKH